MFHLKKNNYCIEIRLFFILVQKQWYTWTHIRLAKLSVFLIQVVLWLSIRLRNSIGYIKTKTNATCMNLYRKLLFRYNDSFMQLWKYGKMEIKKINKKTQIKISFHFTQVKYLSIMVLTITGYLKKQRQKFIWFLFCVINAFWDLHFSICRSFDK